MLSAWRKLRRLPAVERRLALEAAAFLLLARLLLLIVPFPRLVRHFGGLQAPSPGAPVCSSHSSLAREIGRMVERTADHLGCGLVCLPRALAASHMLARRGISTRLHFGAARLQPAGKMLTHAWLETQGAEVTGYPLAADFVEVGYLAR